MRSREIGQTDKRQIHDARGMRFLGRCVTACCGTGWADLTYGRCFAPMDSRRFADLVACLVATLFGRFCAGPDWSTDVLRIFANVLLGVSRTRTLSGSVIPGPCTSWPPTFGRHVKLGGLDGISNTEIDALLTNRSRTLRTLVVKNPALRIPGVKSPGYAFKYILHI
jgi:hypothetical protein